MQWALLALGLLLIVANGLFVAAEFSLVTVERSEVEGRAEAGDHRAHGVLAALKALSTQLSGAQLGITLTSLVVGVLAQPALAVLLESPLESLGVPAGAVPGVALATALLLATGLQMVFAELVPKNLAIARPYAVAVRVVPAQRAFTAAAGPMIRFLNGNANAVLRRMGIEPQEELASARSPEELQSLLRRSAETGTLDAGTAALMSRSLDFGDLTAADVLTPRRRVRFVEADLPLADLLDLVRETGFSRFPVMGDGSDDVVGVVGLRVALRVPAAERAATTVADVMLAPLIVPESAGLDDLLPTLRGHSQLAVVMDEYGGTAGIVTLEDLVEELVGEVNDEHDRPSRKVRRSGSHLLLTGMLRPSELRDLGIPAPDDSAYETVGGLLAARLGRIPRVGDEVALEGWTLRVRRMDGMRVDRIEAVPPTEAGA